MKHTFLPFTSNNCALAPDCIDLWQYPLNMHFPHAPLMLNPTEKIRANQYHFAHHTLRFTQARAMLRLILAHYTHIDPKEISWTENLYGKPELDPRLGIQFNLSHSKDMAILAVGQNYPLGVDVEFFAARSFTGIANIMFSPQEQQALAHAPRASMQLAFYNLWAQKEAFIKACGLGLHYPTQQFTVPILSTTTCVIEDLQTNINWHMTSFMPQVGCCAAVCYHPSIKNIRYLVLEHPLDLE